MLQNEKKQNIVENVIQITEFTSLYSGEYENRVVSDVRISVYTVQSVVINDNNCLMQWIPSLYDGTSATRMAYRVVGLSVRRTTRSAALANMLLHTTSITFVHNV